MNSIALYSLINAIGVIKSLSLLWIPISAHSAPTTSTTMINSTNSAFNNQTSQQPLGLISDISVSDSVEIRDFDGIDDSNSTTQSSVQQTTFVTSSVAITSTDSVETSTVSGEKAYMKKANTKVLYVSIFIIKNQFIFL